MLISPPPLEPFLGKNMGQICPFTFGKKNKENHCAHFVGHAMGYESFAVTCKNQASVDKRAPDKGVVIRVDEIFNISPNTGPWNERPARLSSCLIFATVSRNIASSGGRLVMKQDQNKHIGIFVNGAVWHYGNTQDKVVRDHEMLFVNKFEHEYRRAGKVQFFYGQFLK